MIGAIIGDIVGSRFEFRKIKSKEFELFTPSCEFTDDTVMTLAVGMALTEAGTEEESFKRSLVEHMQELGREYPDAGYGGMFYHWIFKDNPKPYNSFGNGSGMRVSPVGWAADTLEETERLARYSAEVTHNHPEGIKGAQAIAASVFLARTGKSKEEIQKYLGSKYYDLQFTLDEIRPGYHFDVTCQGSVPEAIVAFLESDCFEDAIRNAVSLGGDTDTQAAMAGAIAEAFYGTPEWMVDKAIEYLDERQTEILDEYTSYLKG